MGIVVCKFGGTSLANASLRSKIYDYIEAFRALEYSVSLDKVYNPSACDVYIIHEEREYKIPAGKTVIF